MKKYFCLLIIFFGSLSLYGQVPQAFKYQAVARDAVGSVLANQMVSFRISIVPGSPAGSADYTETHKKMTNGFGLVDLEIGKGTVVSGSFSSIDWGSNIYFFKVELDPAGGSSFISMGTSQLLSVPYALRARNAEIDKLTLPYSDSASYSVTPFTVKNSGSALYSIFGYSKTNYGVYGKTDGSNAAGVLGYGTGANYSSGVAGYTGEGSTAGLPGNSGVIGQSNANIGVAGTAISGTGGYFSSQTGNALKTVGKVQLTGIGEGTGKVLTSDASGNATWQILATNPWVYSHSYVYTLGNNVGIGTNSPGALLTVDGTGNSSGGSVLFTGDFNSSTPANPPASGTGTRMMWYPPKGAFRAGTISGTQWDKNYLGYYSAAFGNDCTASGDYSLSAGGSCSASEDYAVALGSHATATGQISTSIGYYTEASNNCAFATGYLTTASGNSSAAFNNSTTASGGYSASFGFQTHASNYYAFSQGYASDATGVGSLATGLNTTASGMYAISSGSNSEASGMYSFSGGYGTTAPSLCEFVVGMNNTTYTGNPSSYLTSNRIFVVGNGSSAAEKSNAMVILKNGSVGIGVDAPVYTLAVSGTAAKTGGGSWTNLSDRRLKDIKGEYSKGLNEIIALRPVIFNYKKDNPLKLNSIELQVGFVAQEVQEVFPEAVSMNSEGYLDFNMHAVNVALVNAIKELKAENDRLKAENERLKDQTRQFESRLSKLEASVFPSVMK